MSEALAMIAAERARQIAVEGYSPDHDDEHDCGAIACAAASYAMDPRCRAQRNRADGFAEHSAPGTWHWGEDDWKPSPGAAGGAGRIRELVKAGALIVAEIERIQRERAETPDGPPVAPGDRVRTKCCDPDCGLRGAECTVERIDGDKALVRFDPSHGSLGESRALRDLERVVRAEPPR